MAKPFRILCAVDVSPPAAAACEQAPALSAQREAQLVVVHAVSKGRPYSWGAVERVAALAALRERAEADQQLHTLVDTQDAESEVLVSVSSKAVDDEILRVAGERKADLIVLGATRRADLSRWFLGSTALRVSRRSPLPVLILPTIHIKRDLSMLDEAVLGWAT